MNEEKIGQLFGIAYKIRKEALAFSRTPKNEADEAAFISEIRRLASEIILWADDAEARR